MEWIKYESIKDLPDGELLLCLDNKIYTYMYETDGFYKASPERYRFICSRAAYECCDTGDERECKSINKYYMIPDLPK